MSESEFCDTGSSGGEFEEAGSTNKRIGKKRLLNESLWKRNVNKVKRQSGKEYKSNTNKAVPKKKFCKLTKCCPKQCFQNVSTINQKQLFHNYYALSDHSKQSLFLNNCMIQQDIKSHKTDRKKDISVLWEYNLPLSNQRLKVCRKLILSLFQISEKRVRCVQNKCLQGVNFVDNRGRHGNRPNKIDDSVWQIVDMHLKEIPHRESHYSRNKSRRLYFLNPSLNVTTLFNMFKEYYFDKTRQNLNMKYKTYHKYFLHNTLYTFKKPRSDECDFCVKCEIEIKNNPGNESLKSRLALHKKKVESHKKVKHEILEKSKQVDSSVLVLEFDYGQNLPLPKLSVNSQFYKRLLWLNIFNVHCHNDGSSTMYCYPETESKKNPDSVVSCLYDFIKNKLTDKSVTEIVLLSDNAGGQNKNISVVRFCTFLAQKLGVEVMHLFPVRGHSYSQNDRNFGIYSKPMKSVQNIYSIEQYTELIGKYFTVKDCSNIMKQWGDALKNYTMPKPTSKGLHFAIQSYVRIKYNKVGTVMASSTYSGYYQPFSFIKRGVRFGEDFESSIRPVNKNPIKKQKENDIKSLFPFLENEDQISWFQKLFEYQAVNDLNNCTANRSSDEETESEDDIEVESLMKEPYDDEVTKGGKEQPSENIFTKMNVTPGVQYGFDEEVQLEFDRYNRLNCK